MSKDIDERFDAEFTMMSPYKGLGRFVKHVDPRTIKSFLRKELADQKARAIDIVRERQLDINARHAYPDGAQGIEACEAIATVLEEKL